MIILEDIKFYKKTGKILSESICEALNQKELFEDTEAQLSSEAVQVLNDINNDYYDVNDYDRFCAELQQSKRSSYLTPYTPQQLKEVGAITYSVKGQPIGFCLKPYKNGGADIVGVHNNSSIRGIGEALIDSAIRLGGTTLDHFDGFLSDFYGKKGFKEYERWDWNDEYAPDNWDYEKDGRPSVILRSLDGKRPVAE